MSTRSKLKSRVAVSKQAIRRHNTRVRAGQAKRMVQGMRTARLRPGAAGVYNALLNPRVQGFLGLEKKYFDTLRGSTAVVTTAAWSVGFYRPTDGYPNPIAGGTNSICSPTQGPGPQQRIGKAIRLTSVQIKGSVYAALTSTLTTCPGSHLFYVALVLDTQTNMAQCASDDVFLNPTVDYHTVVTPLRNLLNSKRFKILKSELFDLNRMSLAWSAPNFATCGRSAPIDWFLPLDLEINFDANTDSDVGNIVDNSLHVACATSNQDGTSYIVYNARIRYLG